MFHAISPHGGSVVSRRSAYIILGIAGSTLAIGLAHWFVPTSQHSDHVTHLLLGLSFLVPIVVAALWFGLRGSTPTALLISGFYFAHTQISWRGQPMENANHYAMMGVYVGLGLLCGTLIEVQNRERNKHLAAERRAHRELVVTSIAALANALEARDGYTREHSEHVARLCTRIARKLGWEGERLELVRLAGLAHDIGKIGVRDDVLFKPDKLTPAEWEAMKRHPALAAEILLPVPQCGLLSSIVICHHESPNGSGYPRGLKREQIPAESLVVSVADVFSALTECRPYKSGMSVEKALSIMGEMSGSKLDRECVSALLELASDPENLK